MRECEEFLEAFVLESQKRFNEFNINETERISTESALSKYSETKLTPISIPLEFISDIQKVQYEVSENNESLADFFEKIYSSPKITSVPVSVLVFDISEISKIKPVYITEYMKTVGKLINDGLNGRLTKSDIDKFTSPEFYGKLKKQVVVSSLPEFVTDKDIIKYNNKMVQYINSNYISTIILPFIKATDYRNKGLVALGNELTSTIKAAIADMETYNNTVIELTSRGKNKDPKSVSIIIAYGSSILYNLCKYMTSMYIRKMSTIINNNEEYLELRDKLLRYFPNGEKELHESVIDGEPDMRDEDIVYSLLNGQGDIFTSIYTKLYDQYKSNMNVTQGNELGDELHSLIDTEIEAVPYDTTPYNNTGYILKRISNGLDTFIELVNDPDESLETIVADSGLDRSLFDEASQLVMSIKSTKFYQKIDCIDDEEIYTSILNEFKHGDEVIGKLATIIKIIYDKFLSIQASIKDNINDRYTNDTRNDETIVWLREFESDFRDLVLQIGKSFMHRSTSLKERINEVSGNECINIDLSFREDSDDNEDYVNAAYDVIYEYNEKVTTERINNIINEAKATKICNYLESSIIFEADDDNSSNNNTSNDSSSTNNDSNTSDNKDDNAKPTVTVSNDDNSSDNSNNNENKSENKSTNPLEKIQALIKRIIDGFSKTRNDQKLRSIQNNKDYLMNRSYTNSQVTGIHKYQTELSFTQALDNINAAITGVQSTDKKDNIRTNYFSRSSKSNINKDDKELGTTLTKYYKFKDGSSDKINLSDSALANMIKQSNTGMIDVCINYYENFKNVLEDKQKVIESSLKALDDKLKDNPEKNGIIEELSSVVSLDIGAIANAYRDMASEYYSVLYNFIKANKNNKESDNNDNNNNDNNDNSENK